MKRIKLFSSVPDAIEQSCEIKEVKFYAKNYYDIEFNEGQHPVIYANCEVTTNINVACGAPYGKSVFIIEGIHDHNADIYFNDIGGNNYTKYRLTLTKKRFDFDVSG